MLQLYTTMVGVFTLLIMCVMFFAPSSTEELHRLSTRALQQQEDTDISSSISPTASFLAYQKDMNAVCTITAKNYLGRVRTLVGMNDNLKYSFSFFSFPPTPTWIFLKMIMSLISLPNVILCISRFVFVAFSHLDFGRIFLCRFFLGGGGGSYLTLVTNSIKIPFGPTIRTFQSLFSWWTSPTVT